MKKLLLNIVLFLVMMNTADYLACYISGKPFVFNFLFDIVTPILCAVTAWAMENHKVRKLA